MKKNKQFIYFSRYLIASVGLVLVWRGLWFILDQIELSLLGGNHAGMAIASVIAGMYILYLSGHEGL